MTADFYSDEQRLIRDTDGAGVRESRAGGRARAAFDKEGGLRTMPSSQSGRARLSSG